MYAAVFIVSVLAFGVNSVGMILAVLPGFLFSYFLLECRKTVRLLLSVPLTIMLVLVPTWIFNIFSIPVNGLMLIFLSVAYTIAFALLLKNIKVGLAAKLSSETALILLLVLASVFMTYPLHSGLLPRTDGSSHYYKVWQVRESLDMITHS